MAQRKQAARENFLAALDELPLQRSTRDDWAPQAAAALPEFLADHAVCEQQAALFGLNLIAHYPDDAELVDCMSALATEEAMHLRRVAAILHRRGLRIGKRRSNGYVQALHQHISKQSEAQLKRDRLFVGALIEARSCERFTLLLAELKEQDPEVSDLLFDLGPAERRHWKAFHHLATRDGEPEEVAQRWSEWLQLEASIVAQRGLRPTVHG